MRWNGIRTMLKTAMAFGAGVTAMAALAWLGIAGLAQGSSNGVEVCVGTDRVLRISEKGKPCQSGEQRLLLGSPAWADSSKADSKKQDDNSGSQMGSPSRGQLATKVTAPFEVVDSAGRTIMRVREEAPRGMDIFNDKGLIAAHVGVLLSGGGRVYARSGGAGETAPFAVMAYTTDGAVFGMDGPDGKDIFSVSKNALVFYNGQENPVAKMGANAGGNGYFELADSNGIQTVEAGVMTNGRAIVRVYPNDGKTPIPYPQFLMSNKKVGEASRRAASEKSRLAATTSPSKARIE